MWDSRKGTPSLKAYDGILETRTDSMLANIPESMYTLYTDALTMAFVGVKRCSFIIIYSGQLYMSIFSLASFCIDEFLSTNSL